jgi:PAS domain S-box-containing protein
MKVNTTRANIFWLALPTILVLLMVVTLFWFFDRMQAAGNMRTQIISSLSQAQTLLTMVVDAETSTRGYLLTDDEEFLKPYQNARDGFAVKIRQLRAATTTPESLAELDKIDPLIKAKLSHLATAIALKRSNDLKTVLANFSTSEIKQLMDSIRAEMEHYNRMQNTLLKYYDNEYQTNMNFLFAFIVSASIFMLLFAQVFAYSIYRNIHQRLMNFVHLETKNSLEKQEAMNQQLNLAYLTVQDSERKLEVTLNSIADAVIATDREGRITLMNHVAELLTGWSQEEAVGRAIPEVFKIINKETRQPMAVPVIETLLYGAAQGSNDTVLIFRDGNQCNIANSCAPIRDHDGQVIGAVLVFRDITAENAAQQALLDSNELVKTILGTVADGIITFHVRSNMIETVNPAAEKMFGYEASELIGQRFNALVPELSEDKGSLDYYNASADERANGIVREVTGRLKNGQTFPMEIAVSEMRLGGQRFFTGVLRNITARKHAEAVMRESEYRYRNLFDSIDEGFCVAEMIYNDGNIVDQLFLEINPSFEKQSGLHNAQGRYVRDLVPNLEAGWFTVYHEVLQTGESARFEYEAKAMHRWLDIYICRLGEAGSTKVAILFTNVTDRKRSEQALRDSDERVRLATEATGVGIWEWNIGDNYMRWDAQMFRIYGVEPTLDGIVKREDWFKHLLPEDRRAQKVLDKAISVRNSSNREFRIHRAGEKDEIRHIQSVETIRTDAQGHVESIVGTNLDITELKRTEDILRESERHLRAVIDALPVAIYTTDAEGSLTHFNQTAVEFSGRVPELGTDHWCISMKLYKPNGTPLPHDQCPMAIALKEGRQILGAEAIAERPDGTRVWFTAHPTPLHDTNGKLIGGINMLIDITERKRLDQVLLENNVELKKAKNVAEKANRAKSDFLSNMSHELRTPLSAILGFAQLIDASNPPPTPSQKRSVDQILQAGWYLLDLINEILDLTLIESGHLPVSMETVSLPELLRECETMIEPQALNRNITLRFPKFETPLTVKADSTRLKQALINLLSNAIKYNLQYGSVIVTCAECETNRIRISVEDTGDGLSPEKLAQLFQPFNRLGKENSSEEGTGIGLVMTKRLVKLMGGNIHVTSTVGKGTIFSIDLDMTSERNVIEAEPQDSLNLLPMPVNADAPKRTLLYVEDNAANLSLVEDILASRTDILLITARDGYAGIELARVAQPDLILMDINLPGISGVEALKILSKDPLTHQIPVIALSANAIPRDIDKGLQAGFFRYLTKPIKINEFMQTINSALELSIQKPMRINEEKMT